MTPAVAEHLRNWYHAYVLEFAVDAELHPVMQLKVDHSLRVAQIAQSLAVQEEWPEEGVRLAEVLGLYHDVGRYSQYADFGTFHDRSSVNHGTRGKEVLLDRELLACCAPDECKYILESVAHHNCRCVPPYVTGKSRQFVNLVRDADKLDISEVFLNAISDGMLTRHPEILWDLTLAGPPSQVVVDTVTKGQMADARNVNCLADHLLLQMSWVFDLNYPASCAAMRDRRTLERLAERLPEGEGAQAVETVLRYRDERLGKVGGGEC